jgi:GNAT superfamily N-acetyltransferase
MRSEDIAVALEWAKAEGWNPGRADGAAFSSVDPQGLLIAELDGVPAATISCVNYDDRFAFLGFYIVREDLRGNGHGLKIWNRAVEHAGQRVIGLDGVVAQQDNYKKSGFKYAYANFRYAGVLSEPPPETAPTIPLQHVPLTSIEAYDATVFPAPRPAFLRTWIQTPGQFGRALMRDGRLAGWGVIRPAVDGWKVGPLFADDRHAAEAVLAALLAERRGERICIDVPNVNGDAEAMARELGFQPTFETARMYTGQIRPIMLSRIYGVTSLELG